MNEHELPTPVEDDIGTNNYRKNDTLRDFVWIWISIIITVLVLSILSIFLEGDVPDVMNHKLFYPLVIIICIVQLIVAVGFLYLDSIKKNIGEPLDTPENYEEWDEFMKAQSKSENCSSNKLVIIIPIIVLIICFVYNILIFNSITVWILIFMLFVLWVGSLILNLVHTNYSCSQNTHFLNINNDLVDKFKYNVNKHKTCNNKLNKKKEKCNRNIKNLKSNYLKYLNKIKSDKKSNIPSPTSDHDIEPTPPNNCSNLTPNTDNKTKEDTNEKILAFDKISTPNNDQTICGYTMDKCKSLTEQFGGSFYPVNNGPGGCYKYENDYYFNNSSKDCNKQTDWPNRIPLTEFDQVCGYTSDTCRELSKKNGGNFYPVENGPGGCYKYGTDYFFNNKSKDCNKQEDWPNRIPIAQFDKICGYTPDSCKELSNKYGGSFNPVNNGPGGCYKYEKDYYFNNTSQDCSKQAEWSGRIPITKN